MAAGVAPDGRDSNPIRGQTPLMLAVISDKPELVRLFVQCGANPDIKDAQGRTALNIAERLGADQIMPLLKLAADPQACARVLDQAS